LTALGSNAKKDSIRADVAKHLQSHYHPPSANTKLIVNKNKNHINPYFDLWAWTNQNLEWAGPEERTVKIRMSHATLPVIYHHFGCVCPSFESLELIRQVAKGRKVLDLGSGNGYWTYMLRRMEPLSKKEKKLDVIPIDNGMSEWRTMWVGDTVQADGVQWLQKNDGGKDAVLLLVYPTVGNEFTSKMIKAYRESIITLSCAVLDADCPCRWHNDHLSRHSERIGLHCFCQGDHRGLDGARDARLAESAADTAAEFRRQRRSAVHVREEQ